MDTVNSVVKQYSVELSLMSERGEHTVDVQIIACDTKQRVTRFLAQMPRTVSPDDPMYSPLVGRAAYDPVPAGIAAQLRTYLRAVLYGMRRKASFEVTMISSREDEEEEES
jgi:hypothetical protein